MLLLPAAALSSSGSLQPDLQPDSSLQSSNRPASPVGRKDPVAAPSGQWAMQPGGLNCFDGHGAPGASGSPDVKSVSLDDCRAACLHAPGCRAVVVEFESPPEMRAWSNLVSCYLREEVRPEECVQGATNYELYTFELDPLSPLPLSPLPPAPPPSPPLPPRVPAASPAARINHRFRTGRPSNNLTEVGVLFRQFDGLEVHERPWEACEVNCHTQLYHEVSKSAEVFGRLSASIAYRGLRDRADRESISLAYSDRAGYVLRNDEVSLQCLYGKDAAVSDSELEPDSNPAGTPTPPRG